MFPTAPLLPEEEWFIRLERTDEGRVAVLTLDTPDRLNGWSWEATRQLAARADQIRFDPQVRAVLLRANGRAFCAGIDAAAPGSPVTGRSDAELVRNYYEGIRHVHERLRAFSGLPQPVVAAVQGYCLGFGFELALMCDIRVAAADAVFALPEVTLGVAVDAGGDLRLAREVGAGWAKLLALTGRRIDAATAERIGAVQSVVPNDQLHSAALEVTRELAANAPLAVQAVKRSIDAYTDQALADGLRTQALSAAALFASTDKTSGYAAAARRERATFEGR
ncbi:enoyl-CoA hydratase/isomerase family protein [Streptacidiphilus jiangxiensis]|uniref:Enoyl-CoA hydratase/carnithine racemase n=1 Tax=Streptacidiphilus jiangxiensis TaxID=235985 RepID=A0A1H7ULG7_STRJI|nr:enoyl-CoA hydratase/isomerase family protein [Streptacidiphilus jiangxiensis]SEL97595.1 Enoyl-CoA hydratase/carnithine racemase [Streptacidiphilus jiangxiensis]